ncbi:APC family permease [Mycolicibacterium aubagnense]|uniref:Amino acid permease n=1 Tax=Mycolicibacterium aubagnense TaxID=319707 RepID=A0ABN5YW55_9MYCO|nr:APC family permease [Mycolicibacterium aubagnense]TLH49689.1 amino acid permease [Mycolicibacterium aubagnense]WGI32889.1 APC family permease [Mycolicibacterium aubagnense]BBX85440.1 amino acid permease [Mycolicibacterium aubagnense]
MTGAPYRSLVAETSPVEGLPRRQLRGLPVLAQAVAAIAPTGTACVTPALVIASVGGAGAIWAFICATVVIALVSECLRPMARRMAAVGGLYSYTARGLGPGIAVPTGWSAILGYATVGMVGLIAVGAYLVHIAVALGISAESPIAAVAGIAAAAGLLASLIMIRGIRISAIVALFTECVSIVIVVAMLIVLITRHPAGAPIAPALTWDGNLQSWSLGVFVAISAFVGFESPTTLSREAQRPFISVPRAIRWTPLATAVIYLVAVPVQAVALADAPGVARESSTPIVQLLLADGSTALACILDVGIAASFFACTLASVNALVRVLFCMGREGVAPKWFGRTHDRFRTPAWAIAVSMAVVTAVPITVLILGATPEDGLRIFLTLSACGYLGSYLAACMSSPILLRRIGESTPAVWYLATITTGALLYLAVNAVVFAVHEGSVLLTIYGAFIITSILFTLALKCFAPARLAAVGIYDETQRADLLNAGTFR